MFALSWVEIFKQISIGNRSAIPLFETLSMYRSYFMACVQEDLCSRGETV